MREVKYITIPPINQLFVTVYIRLYISNLESLLLLPYGSGGHTVMNPRAKDRIKEAYAAFLATGHGETMEAIENYFQLNLICAKLGNNQGQELYNVQPFTIRYEKE